MNARVYGCKTRTESLDRDTPASSDTKLCFLQFLVLEASSQFLDAPFLLIRGVAPSGYGIFLIFRSRKMIVIHTIDGH